LIKRLLKEKKNVAAVAGVMIAALFAIVLYVFVRPASQVEATEMPSVDLERQGHETAEYAVSEMEHSENGTPAPPEIGVFVAEDDIEQDAIEKVDDAIGEESNENSNDEPKDEEKGEDNSPPQYIGRQPPKGYVEPEGDKNYVPRLLEYKDTYQSNIVVILDDLFETDHTDYVWFHPTSDALDADAEIFDFVAYAILTYYDGDVPCDYSFKLEEDCHNMHPETTWIFEIQTHGDKPLNICLDTYNYKIYVEEGIVERGLSWAEEHGR
jgi:hypothetical protein